MRTLYIDCFSGLAGDMMLGALLDLGLVEESVVRAELATLDLTDWSLEIGKAARHGIVGTDVHVVISGEEEGPADEPADHHGHHHEPGHDEGHEPGRVQEPHPHSHGRSWKEIEALIDRSGLAEASKALALRIFRRLAEAEGRLHGLPADEIRFHEVGAVDAIIDICGVAVALTLLDAGRTVCAPVPTPGGLVRCAHGIMPLPAPATLELLRGAVTQQVAGRGEWVTPTGAAILMEIVDDFGPIPSMRIDAIGYGVGDRDPAERANLLRLIVGAAPPTVDDPLDLQIETNIDDMNPELFGHLSDVLFECGALDVWLTPVQMKKGRPGTTLAVLCTPDRRQAVIDVILRESTTIGVRISRIERYKTVQRIVTVQTAYGEVRVKVANDAGRIVNSAPEYEDCRRLAKQHSVPLKKVLNAARSAIENETL